MSNTFAFLINNQIQSFDGTNYNNQSNVNITSDDNSNFLTLYIHVTRDI